MITFEDLITASGKYPERLNSPELTDEVQSNLRLLGSALHLLFTSIDLQTIPKVSSGFRPSNVNAAIPNAAKRSSHMIGKAVDLVDIDGSIHQLILDHAETLKVYGLWIEDRASTPVWCHLDMVPRSERPINMFKP